MKMLRIILSASLLHSAIPSSWSYDTLPWTSDECSYDSQSPIDIRTEYTRDALANKDDVRAFEFVTTVLTQAHTAVLADTSTGHALKLNFEPNLAAEGLICPQLHFHYADSEHAINGALSFGEMHVVCHRDDFADLGAAVASSEIDALRVFGFMVEDCGACADNAEIQALIDGVATNNAGGVNAALSYNIPQPTAITGFYRYQGSLTTPGCFEIVTWTVMKESIGISNAQALVIGGWADGVLTGNNRPVQEVNRRDVAEFGWASGSGLLGFSALLVALVMMM